MGLVQAAVGSIGGTLADQWTDFYTVPDGLPPTAALFAAVPRGTNAGRGSNTRGSSNIITNGSRIVVPEGYGLLLMQDGAVTDDTRVRASAPTILELADAAGRSASTVATMDVEMNEADSLEALSGVLERLTENPYDISLHVEHIRIARATGMDDHVDSALEMMTVFWAAGDGVWLPLIAHKIAASNLESPEDLQSILDLFTRAERDYLCE